MKNLTEIALEKYPPKGMADPQDWQHDENAEQRKAFIAGYEYALNELLQSFNLNHTEYMKIMAERINSQVQEVNGIMAEINSLVHKNNTPTWN